MYFAPFYINYNLFSADLQVGKENIVQREGRSLHMKQKYTIKIDDTEMNVVTEEDSEFVDEIVGIVGRKIREINAASRRCSKTEAALLCALDCCSDKIKMQKKLHSSDAENALRAAQINRLTNENEKLRELLRRHGIQTNNI